MAGEQTLLRAELDCEFVAVMTIGRVQRRLVRRFYDGGGLGRENLIDPFADNIVARKMRQKFERTIGKNITSAVDALGGHAYRHIVEHRFQELLGRGKLSRKLA